MDNIDIGTLLAHVLHPSRVILQALYYQLLVDLFLEAERQQRDLLVGEEVLDVPVGLLPLIVTIGFEEHPLL